MPHPFPLTIDAWIFLPDVIGTHEIVSKLDNTTGNKQVAYELVSIDDELQGAVKVLGIHVNDQFGAEQLDTIKEEEFCAPSEKILP